ncbi:hypothetical protein RS130_15255 [Paraglaciecola aquimarina]|uniref:Uncharacterized protein n=1 Tax=Paraglaciecola aquimarina TaxID=1235557 RepID=A0ABU3SYI4_9ALTE|nr:hypothetical protein [Paraglaciecola aquimarina]MDU0355075.1 hypothetical protein [Paraglaciecola aquimarina]
MQNQAEEDLLVMAAQKAVKVLLGYFFRGTNQHCFALPLNFQMTKKWRKMLAKMFG